MAEDSNIESLTLERINGFDGSVPAGLIVHPDNCHLLYPLGCNVIIENLSNQKQCILSEHTNDVTCLTVDPSGKFLASGQKTFMGFKADIVVWDYETKKVVFKESLHKVKVQGIAFTADSNFLITLGGRDDGAVVVWHLGKKIALCGEAAQKDSAGISECLAASKVDRNLFVTGGRDTLCVWTLDAPNRKLKPMDVILGGSIKRTVLCIKMADEKSTTMPFMFCGTSTGDIMGVNLNTHLMQFIVPAKHQFSLGVTALTIVGFREPNTYDFLIGTGCGKVGRFQFDLSVHNHKVSSTLQPHSNVAVWEDKSVTSAVRSIAKRGAGHMFFVGLDNSHMYRFNYADMSAKLIRTCHSSEVNDLLFPYGSTELVVSCQHEEIRVWSILTGEELRRYTVRNMTCNAICITRDGKNIFSAWDDGEVKVIGFGKGQVEMKQLWCIKDTHNKSVSAIAITTDSQKLVTGGGEGQVRVWKIVVDPINVQRSRGEMLANMKEHKGKVTAIQIHPMDHTCVSASSDGSTIVWCLKAYTRKQIVLSNTLFKCVTFGAKGLHILTAGTDRKIGYWEVTDGSALRELEGSKAGAINTLDIASDGKVFVTGGEEKLLKLWTYNEGSVTHVGIGHSDEITKVKICPNRRIIVSAGKDGSILVWKFPEVY